MLVEFAGQSSQDADTPGASTSRLVNCYREPAGTGIMWLKSVLGMSPHAFLPGVFHWLGRIARETVSGR